MRIGERVELIAGTIATFGSEPYLVSIGNDVTISNDVEFITHDGGLRAVRDRHPGAFYYAPITVGDRVFIGARSLLLPGVTVGDRAVIGAGSIVTRDVPPDTVVAGAPARVLGSVEEYWPKHQAEWIDTSALTEVQKEQRLRALFGLD